MDTALLLLLSGLLGTATAIAPAVCPLEVRVRQALEGVPGEGGGPADAAVPRRSPCGPRAAAESRLAEAKTLMVQFQDLHPRDVDRADPDVLITDYSWDGSGNRELSRADVRRLRWRWPQRPRIVLAYVSVGEAEDYRYYWQRATRGGSATFLDRPNGQWPGNVRVRFWDPAWHRVLFGGPGSWIDRILDAGFDGVFLDTVDAAESWADEGRQDAPARMNDLIDRLARHARQRDPGFLIVASNPFVLLDRTPVLATLSGIVAEDHFLRGDALRPPRAVESLLRPLRQAARDGATILAVEYPASRPGRERFRSLCSSEGFLCFAGVRALNQPGTLVPREPRPEAMP